MRREVLLGMSARIAHRGPDGEGIFLNHEKEATPARPIVGFVHRRLAVIDPQARADQPFSDGEGRWIIFNGEIYNFRELRAELARLEPGYRWRTECDTEVLLRAYAAWGKDCLPRLNGMYAFAVWDENAMELMLARDRMGQKPLYWAAVGADGGRWAVEEDCPGVETGMGAVSRVVRIARPVGAIAFASELSALRLLPWLDGAIDDRALGNYLRWGYVPSPQTIYQGAEKLPPAMWMRITSGGGESARYFCPNVPAESGVEGQCAQRTRELVIRAVARQRVADVPLGVFLSGGIDSSVVAAALARRAEAGGEELHTFSIGFDDPRYDETGYAAAVAKHLGTVHRRFVVRPDAAADLPRLAEVFGEPFGDSSALPTHYLARETRRHVKVALSGDGGDELFGGYDRYRAVALAERLHSLPGAVRRILASRRWQRVPGSHPKSRWARAKRFLASIDLPPAERYASFMRLFDESRYREIVSPDVPGLAANDRWLAREYERWLEQGDPVWAALATDRMTYLPEDLHTKVDRASMLHALEVRSPFMDHELVAFAAGLRGEQLLKGGGKRLLREAFAGELPSFVFRRRKMGFAVPVGDWLRGELRPMLRELLLASDSFAGAYLMAAGIRRLMEEHESRRADHSERLYALLMLELWWRASR